MNPDEKQMLRDIAEQVAENNKLLHKLYSKARWGTVVRAAYWLVIIGLSVGSYYFIQPYVNQLMGVYSGLGADVGTVKSVAGGATDLLKNLGR
ncbi:MAG: hypothetical protein WC250_02655 [Candidatus Paceibacterota bacterium]|jgi:hypothetical protein